MTTVREYYRHKGSKWGYRLILKGIRHFGYYPGGQKTVSHRQAQYLMVDRVAKLLDLPSGAKVLDAGCGEGHAAAYLAKKYGYQVVGIDLLKDSIQRAKQKAAKQNGKISFYEGSYMKLPFKDGSFDAIYTIETLVHAPDANKAIKELKRVLKPGGKLALVEYTMTPYNQIEDPQVRMALKIIVAGSSMSSLPNFTHGSFKPRLERLGFSQVKVRDQTANVMPMLLWFYKMAWLPYKLMKLFNKDLKHPNTTAGAELYPAA